MQLMLQLIVLLDQLELLQLVGFPEFDLPDPLQM